jgi:hypothetical protein
MFDGLRNVHPDGSEAKPLDIYGGDEKGRALFKRDLEEQKIREKMRKRMIQLQKGDDKDKDVKNTLDNILNEDSKTRKIHRTSTTKKRKKSVRKIKEDEDD